MFGVLINNSLSYAYSEAAPIKPERKISNGHTSNGHTILLS